jgi:plasmid maintenance system antidote protein VapI
LREEYLAPLGRSARALAERLHSYKKIVPRTAA